MLFSIIVPTYNVGPYIGECLSSIEKQTFSDYELIVVMDSTSKDESEDIVNSFGKRYGNIKIVYQGHYGLGAARNFGMKYASGDYYIFLDSDDSFGDSNYLQDIAVVIEKKNPDYVITRSQKFVGGKGGEVGFPWGKEILDNPNSRDALVKIINSGYFGISAWGKAVKRDFCANNNLEFVDGYSEDYDWTSQVINLTDKYAFVNTPGVVHYIRPGSLSGDHNYRQVSDLGKRIQKWAGKLSDNNEFEKAQLGYLAYSYYIYIASINFVTLNQQQTLWIIEKEIRYLRRYGVSRKCVFSNLLCSVLGIRWGSKVLCEYVKRKKSV